MAAEWVCGVGGCRMGDRNTRAEYDGPGLLLLWRRRRPRLVVCLVAAPSASVLL